MTKFDILIIFAQNIDRGYSLELTCTNNLCFRAKLRKLIYTPVNHSFSYTKVGC